MGLLARREHSYHELQQKLRQKGAEPADIEVVLSALKDEGLQSDERFTESFINSRARRGYGPSRIRAELIERKVDEILIESYLDEQNSTWIERALAVINKKSGGEIPKDYAQRVKLMNFLQYRGFTHAQIKAVVDGE